MSLADRARNVGPTAYKAAGDIYWKALDVQAGVLDGSSTKAEQDDAEEATRVLEGKFPSIREGVSQGGADSWAQSMSGNTSIGGNKGSGPSSKPKAAAKPAPATRPKPAAKPSPKTGSRRAASGARTRVAARRRGGSGWAGRAIEQTGVPGAARSFTANTLEFVGVLIGLSLAYLLLSNAQSARKGRSAIELLTKGVATGVQRVVSTDPAFGKGSTGAVKDGKAAVGAGLANVDQAAAQAIHPLGGAGVIAGLGNVTRGVGAARSTTAGGRNARGQATPTKQRVFANP